MNDFEDTKTKLFDIIMAETIICPDLTNMFSDENFKDAMDMILYDQKLLNG